MVSPTASPAIPVIPQPLAVRLAMDPTQGDSEHADRVRQEERDITNASWQRAGIAINGVLFLLIAIQAFLSGRQLSQMKRQAKAAEDILNDSRETNRAYIAVLNAEMVRSQQGQLPEFSVTLVNGGSTPALSVQIAARLQVDLKENRSQLKPGVADKPVQEGQTLVPNRPSAFVMALPTLSLEENKGLKSGTHAARLSVRVYYQDIFGEKYEEAAEFGMIDGEKRLQFVLDWSKA